MMIKYRDTRRPGNVELHKPAEVGRDPLDFPRITGFGNRQGKTRDPKKRDHGFQSLPLREMLSSITIFYHTQ
jgi:hypothetical protein